MLINGDPDDPRQDKKAYRAYERLLQSRLKEIQRKLQPEEWPTGLKWWRDTRYLQELRNRYTHLEAILRELYKARLDSEESKSIHEKYGIPYHKGKKGQDQRLLFVRTNHKRFAGRVWCSVVTLKYYLRELTKTGLIQFHYKPHNYSYYAIGYYSKTPQGYRGY